MSNNNKNNGIRGLLLDLNGVFYNENIPVPGGRNTIHWLRENAYRVLFLTNTTTRSISSLHKKLISMDLDVEKSRILSPSRVASGYMHELGFSTIYPVVRKEALEDYKDFEISDKNPDAIVIGDIGNNWNYSIMNHIFELVMSGSKLIALHKNRYFQNENGLVLDAGPFIAAIEYATGITSTIIGKPSQNFFRLALQELDLTADQVIMIGDDIESDIGGAQSQGIRGVIVKTGKYRDEIAFKSQIEPHARIESIADLPDYLSRIKNF